MRNQDYVKIAIVGAGKVGMTAAYALLLSGLANEIVLFGRDASKLTGEKLDLEHAGALSKECKIVASDQVADLAETDIVIYCAGAAQAPGETRLDLAEKNVGIMEKTLPPIAAVAGEAVFLLVANPVDVLTARAIELLGLPAGRVLGSGTTLDTARFRFHLSENLPVNPRSIHTYVLGEHGESSFPLVSGAMIGGQRLLDFPGISRDLIYEAYGQARDAAAAIIETKGATYYGIGAAVKTIVRAIVRDTRAVLPVSVPVSDYYGVSGVCLSLPAVIGAGGGAQIIWPLLDNDEQAALQGSANNLRQVLG